MGKLKKNKNAGITLIALVVTIIVLLILAGISIMMLSGNNGILQRTIDAKENTEVSQIKERINLAYHSALADGQGNITEDLLEKELSSEFGFRNIDYTLMNSKDGKSWTISINGTNIKENIIKPTNLQTEPINPEVEYGYSDKTGVVDAISLIEGDIINYYYDKEKEPISCAVLYNDTTHGLQVVALKSIIDVTLGYLSPKTTEAFENQIPNGYSNTYFGENFEKSRYTYNHAFKILKENSMNYVGDMAITAKCIGAPDDIQLKDNETNNMNTITFGAYEPNIYSLDFKNSDNYYLSHEIEQMEALNILKSEDSKAYWIASRFLDNLVQGEKNKKAIGQLYYVSSDGNVSGGAYSFALGYTFENNRFNVKNTNPSYGLRPIFLLRDDIKVEKTGHLN